MELLRRMLSAVGFDCMRRVPKTQKSSSSKYPLSPTAPHAAPHNSCSQELNPSLHSDSLHCQSCISYETYLKRLSCGHLYCDSCMDRIVNQAFLDIESLCNYPCPMCNSIRQLGLEVSDCSRPTQQVGISNVPNAGAIQQKVIKEMEEPKT